jgi:hypothetical protein
MYQFSLPTYLSPELLYLTLSRYAADGSAGVTAPPATLPREASTTATTTATAGVSGGKAGVSPEILAASSDVWAAACVLLGNDMSCAIVD